MWASCWPVLLLHARQVCRINSVDFSHNLKWRMVVIPTFWKVPSSACSGLHDQWVAELDFSFRESHCDISHNVMLSCLESGLQQGNHDLPSTPWDFRKWEHTLFFFFILLKYSWFKCVNFCCTTKWLSYTYIHPHILFHYRLSQDIEHRSLCHTVVPCCLSGLHILVCICLSQTPNPSSP